MPGSNTGALESAMWSLLGCKDVDVLAWENFGSDWAVDVLEKDWMAYLSISLANCVESLMELI